MNVLDKLPTCRELDNLGHDAGAYLDAAQSDLERAIPMAANEASRQGLIDDLKAVKALRERYFSASSAHGRISA